MKLSFVFPGQGVQKIGMAKDYYDKFPTFRHLLDDISEWTGIDLVKLIFLQNEDINQTEFTQLSILSVELCTAELLKENGIKPSVLAGYSLGEYAALAVSGVLSYKDAVLLIKERGRLMAEAGKKGNGGMAAVLGMDVGNIKKCISEFKSVEIVNYNTSSQVSIAGLKTEVEAAAEKLREAGARRVVVLNVSGAFHSSLMKSAAGEFGKYIDKCKLNAVSVPYYPNVTGKIKTNSDDIRELLIKQICSPVLWQQSMQEMFKEKIDAVVEVGPGRVLRGFMRDVQGVQLYGTDTAEDFENLMKVLKNG